MKDSVHAGAEPLPIRVCEGCGKYILLTNNDYLHRYEQPVTRWLGDGLFPLFLLPWRVDDALQRVDGAWRRLEILARQDKQSNFSALCMPRDTLIDLASDSQTLYEALSTSLKPTTWEAPVRLLRAHCALRAAGELLQAVSQPGAAVGHALRAYRQRAQLLVLRSMAGLEEPGPWNDEGEPSSSVVLQRPDDRFLRGLVHLWEGEIEVFYRDADRGEDIDLNLYYDVSRELYRARQEDLTLRFDWIVDRGYVFIENRY